MQHPELEPGELLSVGYYGDKTAAEQIYGEVIGRLQANLARQLVDDDFSAQLVNQKFAEAVADGMDSLIPEALRNEREWEYVGTALHEAFGLQRPEGHKSLGNPNKYWQGPVLAPMPPAFADDLLGQVSTMDVDFERLETMHRAFKDTELLALFKKYAELALFTPSANEETTDRALELSESIVFNPDYVLPEDQEDALYLLCFMPWSTRRYLKQAMVANQVKQRMDQALGSELTEEEQEVYDAMLGVLAHSSFYGQEWEEMGQAQGISEATALKIMDHSILTMEYLARVQRLRDQGKGERVTDAYNAATEALWEKIEAVAHAGDLYKFANTDIGHGFEQFNNRELGRVIGHGVHLELANIQKNGLHAVIFEDDAAQLERYTQATNDFSEFSVSDDHKCMTSEAVEPFVEDPTVGRFVLDIQNGQNKTAGIRLAHEIITRRARINRNIADGQEPLKTEIIVWSASPEGVAEAADFFRRMLDASNNDSGSPYRGISYSVPGGGGSFGSNPITLSISEKSWKTYTIATPKRVPDHWNNN